MGVDMSTTGVPQFDNLEVVQSGNFTANWSFGIHSGPVSNGIESQTLATINHNLGYIPQLMLSRGSALGVGPLNDGSIYSVTFQSNAWQVMYYNISLTSTQLVIYLLNSYSAAAGGSTNGASASGDPYVYYLLRTRARSS